MDTDQPPAPIEALPPLPPREVLVSRYRALPALGDTRLREIEQAAPHLDDDGDAAIETLKEHASARQWMRVALQLVDEFSRAVKPLAACRRGCSHCCHIKVEMTELEAEQLGEAIGRRPNRKYRYMSDDSSAYSHLTPCPFLADDRRCSIYEHRPFACRRHHNLDSDDLFCRLDMPQEFGAGVLKIQPNHAMFAYAGAMAPAMRFGDIRDWFPGPTELSHGPVGRIAKIRDRLKAMDDSEG